MHRFCTCLQKNAFDSEAKRAETSAERRIAASAVDPGRVAVPRVELDARQVKHSAESKYVDRRKSICKSELCFVSKRLRA